MDSNHHLLEGYETLSVVMDTKHGKFNGYEQMVPLVDMKEVFRRDGYERDVLVFHLSLDGYE